VAELSAEYGSLEEAFLRLTSASTEFRGSTGRSGLHDLREIS
jgi:hypothetical protein